MLFAQTMNKLTDTMTPSSFLAQRCLNPFKLTINKHSYVFYMHLEIIKYFILLWDKEKKPVLSWT